MGMKSIMFMCVPLMIALVFMAGDADGKYYSCHADLYPCYDYLDSNNTPADACCSSMKEATANQFLCLCSLSSSNPNVSRMNFTQARSLRSRCHLEDLSPSNCTDMDTLRQGEKLRSPNHLVSAAQVFALGFFIPQGSMESYLAIWYTDYPTKIVWIADRDKAIEFYSGFLTINETGSFLIDGINPYNVSPHSEMHTLRSSIISANPKTGSRAVNREHLQVELYRGTTTANSNLSATLLDNGNLVLSVVNSDGSQGRILWQSFDFPTDTLLPAMRLGFNYIARRNVSLTSWLAENNPSAGLFTMEWDTMASQLVVRRQGVIIWTSGKLKNQSFDYINGSALQNYTLMSDRNADPKFFSYTLNNNLTKNSEWQILYNGTLAFSEDERRYVIPIEERCYGYNTNGGCVNWTQPPCRNDKTTFEFWSGSFILPNGNVDEGIDEKNESLGPSDCRVICWNNCSCVGYSKTNDSGHCTWYMGTGLQFEQDLSGSTPAKYVINRKSSPNDNIVHQNQTEGREQNAGRIKWMWMAVTIPIILLLTFMAIIIYLKKNHKGRGRKEQDILQLMTSDGINNLPELEHGNSLDQNLKVFSLVSIIEATNNFSPESKLGEGGYGPVYKGILPEKLEIAVKRLSKSSGQGLVEFKNELILIARLQHMNLVRLLGCCIHREEKMLVYEYMPNKSLDSFLFDASKRGLLEWRKRVMIIEGIAQGLLYLHQHSRLRIIHRDLKASNILLDADVNPKISDFGMARIFSHNDLMANTHRIVGTYGYMSPEYALQGIFSVKSDIFSFGVLMLEILSGRKNNSFHDMNGPRSLVQYAWELWQEDRGLELMDPVLKDSSSTQEFLRFLHLGLLCVEDSPVDRPTSSEVISMITNQSIALSSVKKPAYLNLNSVINNDYERNEVEYHSVNVVSISTVSGR